MLHRLLVLAIAAVPLGCSSSLPNQVPAFSGQTQAPVERLDVPFQIVTIARGLQRPWGLAFLPGGGFLVTEKPGRMRVIGVDGSMSPPVAGLPQVDPRGEGGLLGLALDPAFSSNSLVYWSYSEPRENGLSSTAVSRGRLVTTTSGPRLENVERILRQEPAADSELHYGSRLVFGADGTLFVTTGDRSAGEGRSHAQRLDGLVGKVARINPDGTAASGNPYSGRTDARPEIWSIGHRNIQGAALHPETGELWTTEHGTRGGDELNVARPGKDYGWPAIAYGVEYDGSAIADSSTSRDGMEQPLYYWDPLIGPTGMTFYTGALFPRWRGSLFIASLVEGLVRVSLDRERVIGEERLLKEEVDARLRDVGQGPEGAIYVLSDEQSGRLLKLVPR